MPAFRLALLLSLSCFAAAPVGPPPAASQPTVARELKEIWEAAYLEGVQVGYIHRHFRELKYGERTVVEGVVEMELAMSRNGQPVRLQSVQATHENPLGKLRGFIFQEGVREQKLYRKGQVTGPELVWTVQLGSKTPSERRLVWNDKALGLYAQEQLLPQRPASADKTFAYERFEPVFDTLMSVEVVIGPEEEVQLAGSVRKNLRKVASRLDPKASQDAPPEYVWIDAAGEAWKRQTRLPLLGELVAYRATKELATGRREAFALDIGKAQMAPTRGALRSPGDAKAATYRIKLTDVEDLANAFPSDEGQTARPVDAESVEVKVRGLRQPPGFALGQPLPTPKPPPAEYLKSNAFITSDDAEVKRLARTAIGAESDPWRKAVAIEGWVKRNMRGFGGSEAFATAADTAKSRTGDCKAHATLAAAMCRAAGVPSRIAIGLIYVPRERAFGFHMWMEAWVDGQWYALDPTLGQGRVGADHIKILDHHLNGEQSFAPMLPVARLLGRMQIEVTQVENGPGGLPR